MVTTLPKTNVLLRISLYLLTALLFLASTGRVGAADAPAGTDTGKPAIDVLLLGYYIWASPAYVELCKKEGINIYGPMPNDPSGANPANYPVEFLKKFDVVVASGPLERPWDPMVIRTAMTPGIVANLLEYNRQGGGVVWTPLGAGYGARSWTDSIGKFVDATALDEAIDDPSKDVSVALLASFKERMRYIWTTDVTKHPITDGVRGLFFGRSGEWGWPGTIPMQFGPSWTVLVRGMDTMRTTVNGTPPGMGKREFSYTDKTGTFASKPPLIAVRESAGERKGRMLVQPIYTTWTWGNYGHIAMKEAFLLNGDGLHPSDGQRFLLNTWRYLAEPAQQAGFGGYQPPQQNNAPKAVDLSPVVWQDAQPDKLQGGPEKRGLFGAQSKWGGGSGTVADWAKAARAAGLDFIVFTDDPNKHTPETYAALVAECKANSDEKFAIVPGIGGYDINGVYRFFPGTPTLPDRKHFDAQGRIAQPVGLTLDYGWQVGQVVAEMGKMPYNPWWEYVIMACAPLTYDGDKLVDDGVRRWWMNCEAEEMHLLPFSLVRVKSPDTLASAVKNAHLTVLRTNKVDAIPNFARSGAGGQTMPAYLTNGPRLPVWQVDMSPGEPFRPNSSRFRILLKTTSDAGIAEVRLTDAADGSVYRLWKPGGQQEFSVAIDETTTDQRVIGLTVTDVNGRTAVAPPAYTYQGANRLWHMTDRFMGMHHTVSWDPERKQLVSHGTPSGITYHKGIPGGGGEFTTNHIDRLKFNGIEGSGIYPPQFVISPSISTDKGNEPIKMDMRFTQRLAGHDLTVIDYVGDQQYQRDQQFKFNAPPPIPQDTKLATITSREWEIRTRYMAPVVMMVNEVSVVFKQDVTLKNFYLGKYGGPDVTGEFNYLVIKPSKDATPLSWTFDQGETFSRTTEFTPGGYLYQGKALAGTMGFFALDDKIVCQSSARRHELSVNKKYLKEYHAGDQLTVRFLRVSRAFEAQSGSNEWLEKFQHDYGIGVEPAYPLKVMQGTLRGVNYIVELDGQNGGAAIEVGKYDLPEPIPVRVWGVRQQAILGEYDLDSKRVRPLPYFDGAATTSIETQLKATRLYVGEWLSWDNDQARVSLVTNGTNFQLEAHNP
ncbi:MAG TPA: hypothetical protein VGM23_05235, partial [Armatimonadota bacterium]